MLFATIPNKTGHSRDGCKDKRDQSPDFILTNKGMETKHTHFNP